jgi:PAS domain S-box-containing protein
VQDELGEINAINARLTPLEDAFSATLGEASRKTQLLLGAVTVFVATLLILVGILLSRRLLERSTELENALRVSEERYNLAVSGSNDGLWDWNVLTGNFYFSPRCHELVGYSEQEMGNTVVAFISLLHPDDRESTRAATSAHLRYNAPFDLEFRCRCKSGEYRWFRARGRSVRNPAGWAVRMAGSVTDITDRKQTEAQIYAEKERAQGHAGIHCRFGDHDQCRGPGGIRQSDRGSADRMETARGARSAAVDGVLDDGRGDAPAHPGPGRTRIARRRHGAGDIQCRAAPPRRRGDRDRPVGSADPRPRRRHHRCGPRAARCAA